MNKFTETEEQAGGREELAEVLILVTEVQEDVRNRSSRKSPLIIIPLISIIQLAVIWLIVYSFSTEAQSTNKSAASLFSYLLMLAWLVAVVYINSSFLRNYWFCRNQSRLLFEAARIAEKQSRQDSFTDTTNDVVKL